MTALLPAFPLALALEFYPDGRDIVSHATVRAALRGQAERTVAPRA